MQTEAMNPCAKNGLQGLTPPLWSLYCADTNT